MGNWVEPGVGDVGSYQVAGTPYIANVNNGTSTVSLNYVTSEVVVSATAACTVHFGDADSTTFSIPANTAITFKARTKKIVLVSAGVASVCALLTSIPASRLEGVHDQDGYGTTV